MYQFSYCGGRPFMVIDENYAYYLQAIKGGMYELAHNNCEGPIEECTFYTDYKGRTLFIQKLRPEKEANVPTYSKINNGGTNQ